MFSYIGGDIPTEWCVEPDYISVTNSFLLFLFLFTEYWFGLLITTIFWCYFIFIFWCMYDLYTASVLSFLLGEQISVPSFEKDGSEKNDCLGVLKSFCYAEYLPWGFAMFLVKKKKVLSKKKTFKDKIWIWVLNFKCWSQPFLAKQSVSV